MRQIKLTFSEVKGILREIFGISGTDQTTQQQVRIYPGLLNFISNLRTKVHIEKFATKLDEESKFVDKKLEELAVKHFGEDKTKWSKFIMVPVDADIPKKITKTTTPDVPEFVKEIGTEKDIPNPEYKTEEVDNPEYKEKQIENENWDAYKKEETELLETIVEVQCFPFTDNLFDFNTTFCQGMDKQTNNPYFRISNIAGKDESIEQFTPSLFIKKTVTTGLNADNVGEHVYPVKGE